MTLAALAIAISASLAQQSSAWTFRTQTNLLGQPEAVAELSETAQAPGRYVRFSCSVMTGPVFEAGLGARSFENFSSFSATAAERGDKTALSIRADDGSPLQVLAQPASDQVTAHAYVVGGAEATAAAQAIAGAARFTIIGPDAVAEFSAPGATAAIGQTLSACPFTG